MHNVELLQETMAQIEAHPEGWAQRTWRWPTKAPDARCGQQLCFAGTACELAGGKWLFPPRDRAVNSYLVVAPEDPAGDVDSFEYLGVEYRGVSAGDRAQRLLGLDEEEANDLFAPFNGLDDLRGVVGRLVEEAPPDA